MPAIEKIRFQFHATPVFLCRKLQFSQSEISIRIIEELFDFRIHNID